MANESTSESFKLTQTNVLSSNTLIVSNILSFLPIRDLYRSASVCQMWSDMVKREQKRRQQIESVFWQCQRKITGTDSLDKVILEVKRSFASEYSDMMSEPDVALAFATIKSSRTVNTKSIYQRFYESLTPCVPRNCTFTMTFSDGVVGMVGDECAEVEKYYGFSCILLPKIPGMFVKTLMKNELEEYLEDLNKDQSVKALIVLCKSKFFNGNLFSRTFKKFLSEHNKKIAFGGGLVWDILCEHDNVSESTMAIAFCGERIKAASTIIEQSVRTQEELEKIMQKLKNYELPERRSFAFMFACVGRGKRLWKKKNAESVAFRKFFPKTPLFGFFGQGELGMDSCTENSVKCETLEKNDIIHSYTTIIVLVSVC